MENCLALKTLAFNALQDCDWAQTKKDTSCLFAVSYELIKHFYEMSLTHMENNDTLCTE